MQATGARVVNRWSTLLMDEADLGQLARVPTDHVIGHADGVLRHNPGPLDLYARWERQQWSAESLELGPDAERLAGPRTPAAVRTLLEGSIATFIIGEYTGLDMLGPILTGAPDEDYALFLGTQVADETRHTRAVLRMGEEVLGLGTGTREQLAAAWTMVTPAHAELSMLESDVVRGLHRHPLSYSRWLQAVAVFHLITEGVLALVGQRVLVQGLRDMRAFDGIRSAFVAMCRDESRHVGFGIHALRRGVADGYADDICDVLERALPIALRLDTEFDGIAVDFRALSVDVLRKHLSGIGLAPPLIAHLLERSVPAAPAGTGRRP